MMVFLSYIRLNEFFNGASVLCNQVSDIQNTGQH
uniref:Uncharacterized protein n=1 Tax=Arundo donax TaxID=35708 RepID=A0A0A9FGZ0_ARUDO